MLIQGSALSKRTQLLTEKYLRLLENNVEAGDILVLVQNPLKKNSFINEVKSKLKIHHYENPQIHTFYGLCYNIILNYWAVAENSISSGEPVITPNLTGLEISQFFFKNAIKDAGFKDYNSKINLLHQLFRRNSLIVNNNLTDEMVEKRAKILKEVFDKDAKTAIDIFKKKTVEYRAFDYIRQVSIFTYLYQNTDCFKDIKYLILDDADEMTSAEFDFIKHLKPQLEDVYIGYDRHGSSRLGFLNTDIKTVERIETLFETEETLDLDEIIEPDIKAESFSYTRRLEMVQKALEQVEDLIKKGVEPKDICIVTPLIDSALKFAVKEIFEQKEIDYQFFSGSEKLCSNQLVKDTMTLLNMSVDGEVDVFKIRPIFNKLLGIPLKYCMKIIENYKINRQIEFVDLGNEIYNERLNALINTLIQIETPDILLSEKLFVIYENLILTSQEINDNFEKFNFFAKQILDFEAVFEKQKSLPAFQKAVLIQLENSIISENPASSPDIKENAVTISTAQKIIDFSFKSRYQILLDTSSSEWIKDDFGTLYNAWVFQNSWDKDTFTYEDNVALSKIKTKKMLRKLSLLAEEKIFSYSSLFDSQGAENFEGIEGLISADKTEDSETAPDFHFIPRDDQKPVLDYKSGTMAVSAVPGAGKTTILLALIIKLLRNGVKSDNIFVLTYMESAARNFKERIKKACPSMEKLPNISTIHGLALRILKENSNFVKAGLDENFEVCDDAQRQRIIRELLIRHNYCSDDFEKYEKGISALKLSDISQIPYTKNIELQKFLKFYHFYNLYLKNRNILDYDDMLSYCVQILEKNPEIAKYYQNLCKYVIEDEAQDSSGIQQKLISILSAKNKNLIRCGDINQAITTTFTNTDLDGFRNFIKKSDTVTMTGSQRCAKDVYNLANSLIDFSKENEDFKNAFFDIKMQGVEDKNPQSKHAVETQLFDDFNQERSFLLKNIRKIFSKDKTASVAILVRNNFHIEEYSSFFSNFGYNILTRSDSLDRQPVFNVIFALLKFCSYPWRNENVIEAAKIFKNQKLLNLKEADIEFLKELKTPFILEQQDNLDNNALSQLLWDLNYWLENSSLNLDDFTIKAGNYYYGSEIEKSNVYMTALLLKTFENQYSSREALLERLREVSSKPVGSKFKFFNEENDNDKRNKSGIIQIMTYHKSKGDEFDYVFIPNLSEKILKLKKENLKINSKERFLEAVKALNLKYNKKDEKELKLFQIEENLRLFYVAVTRAKKKLFITSARKYKRFSKVKDTEPSILFDTLLNCLGAENKNDK